MAERDCDKSDKCQMNTKMKYLKPCISGLGGLRLKKLL